MFNFWDFYCYSKFVTTEFAQVICANDCFGAYEGIVQQIWIQSFRRLNASKLRQKSCFQFDLTSNLNANEFNIVTRTASFTRSRLGTLSSSKVVHTYSCASCKFLANKYAFSIIPVCMGMRIIIRYSNCVMWKICTKNLCECMCLYAYEHYSCQHESSRSPNGAFSREHIETTITFDIQTLEPILQHVESRMYASVCLMNVLRAYYSIVYHSYISRFYDSVQCAYWRFYFPIK